MRFSVCLSEAGRLLQGSRGLQGHRRSWRDQTLFRVAVPPTPPRPPTRGPDPWDARTDTLVHFSFPGWWDFQLKSTDHKFTSKQSTKISPTKRPEAQTAVIKAPFSSRLEVPSSAYAMDPAMSSQHVRPPSTLPSFP